MKALYLRLDQARWLENGAERAENSEAELVRQAIERLMAGQPAVFRDEAFPPQGQPLTESMEPGARFPPSEDVLKRIRLEGHQIKWIKTEARRLEVTQKELFRHVIDRFMAGPPATLTSNPRSLWRRRDWLYTVSASESLERKWERYRAEQVNS